LLEDREKTKTFKTNAGKLSSNKIPSRKKAVGAKAKAAFVIPFSRKKAHRSFLEREHIIFTKNNVFPDFS
jgi:hypothetical protein